MVKVNSEVLTPVNLSIHLMTHHQYDMIYFMLILINYDLVLITILYC